MPVPLALAHLPVNDVLAELAEALTGHDTAILEAPPGAGKTTVVPLALIDEAWLAGRKIVMLEPRRLAARAAAQRMAATLGQLPGDLVGYQTRDERRIGPATRIEVVTEGVLTRRLQHDPSLAGTGLVIFDEAHERNLTTDVGLALAIDARRVFADDLRLLIMSATLDVGTFTEALGDVPVVRSEGRIHPVEIVWAPASAAHSARPTVKHGPPRVEQPMAALIQRALGETVGDVLAFLPGIGEIRRVHQLLDTALPSNVDVFPLAGALSLTDHDAALAPSPPGRRRVVLSTDIAESSLTVPGVSVVVDAGLARVPRFDPRSGMSRLVTVATSRASADQRAGRAGRTGPGVCYRLWRKADNLTRPMHLAPEIVQADLAGVALEVASWGTPVDELVFLDRPPAAAWRQGNELLAYLGALDGPGRVTEVGRRMLNLPVHPRLARMIDGAAPGDVATACVVAAVLDERDPFRGRPSDLPADVGLRVEAITGRGDDRADRGALRRIVQRAEDLARRSRQRFTLGDVDAERCGAVLLLAYPDRLAIRRSRAGQFQLRSGGTATLDPHDSLAEEAFVVAVDLDGARSGARIRLAAALSVDDLSTVLAEQIERRSEVVWDAGRGDVVRRGQLRLGGMLLSETTEPAPPGPATVAVLLERVRTNGLRLFTNPATQLRARVRFLRLLGDERWPDWSEATLLATLDDWLAAYLGGVTSMTDLAALDLTMVLGAAFDWDTGQRLAELAPPSITTPSGRTIAIDYTRDLPTASSRVQDFYGMTTHPTVGGGRVPVTVELLSPAGRPVQITSDLPGFWLGSWADVRKDMRGRYPKHHWPETP